MTVPLSESSLFGPDIGEGDSLCIADGPFKNITLHMIQTSNYADYCISREFNQSRLDEGMGGNSIEGSCYYLPKSPQLSLTTSLGYEQYEQCFALDN